MKGKYSMEDKGLEVMKQLACDLKNLSELNYAILYNKSYTNLIGQRTLKGLEKVETQLENILDIIERRYLGLNLGDLVDLYKGKNKKEYIQDIIKRLDR